MYVITVLIRMAYNYVCYANNQLVGLEICSIVKYAVVIYIQFIGLVHIHCL
jgi:hypothetical protein